QLAADFHTDAGDARLVEARMEIPEFRWETGPARNGAPIATVEGKAHLHLSGTRTNGPRAASIVAKLDLEDLLITFSDGQRQESEHTIVATLEDGTGKVEINHLAVDAGRT